MGRCGEGRATPSPTSRREAALECRGGVTRPSLVLPAAALVAAALCGCGGGCGVEEGATVSVYAGAAVCARRQARAGAGGGRGRGGAGPRRLRRRRSSRRQAGPGRGRRQCPPRDRGLDRGRLPRKRPARATRFTRPILDEAEIALIVDELRRDGWRWPRLARRDRMPPDRRSATARTRSARKLGELPPPPRAGPRSASSMSVNRNS